MESLTSQEKVHKPCGRQTYMVKDVAEILGISCCGVHSAKRCDGKSLNEILLSL